MIWLLLLPDNICRVISTSNSNLQNNNINLLIEKKFAQNDNGQKIVGSHVQPIIIFKLD